MPGTTEIWLASVHVVGAAAARARTAEREGIDGLSFGDTQHMAGDPFVGLSLAGAATERLKLMVGVTNPVTRHPAVTAAAIATVHAESGGRAVLGVGRGDSSVGRVGDGAAPVDQTARFVEKVQQYLGGSGSRGPIPWIGRLGLPKVPVDVAATGPRMLALGARYADRVTVNVGAIRDRVASAAARVNSVGREAGRSVSLGAYVVIAAHPDPEVARGLALGPVAAYARLSGMPGARSEGLNVHDRAVIEAVTANYDLQAHGQRTARHIGHLDDEFVERFGVVGSPAHCAARLRDLADLGLDRLVLVEGRDANDRVAEEEAHRCLVDEVLPAFRSL
ncbi:MAG: LLM class flavin-dependent oxidoreductase [Acidimicrobiaceae bacterium]|nr:LLM class flavin-dependent oxidoreductase [Acidimicrobiaceae bacterium]